MEKVSFGVFLSTSYDWESNRDLTLEAEGLGYDTVYMTDHLIAGHVPRIESLSTIAALASITEEIRFGQMVLCYAFRNPALLAKMGATIDIISKGRFELGIGAGWCREEFESYGYPFPKFRERLKALREAVTIIRKMWTEEAPTFEGDYFTIKDAYSEPKPVQKPHPPIMIGGESRRLIRVAAEMADKYNTLRLGMEEFRQRMEWLDEYRTKSGRDPSKLKKSFGFHLKIYRDEKELMENLRQTYKSQGTKESFNDWVEAARDEELGYLYRGNGRERYAGTTEQVLKRIEAYVRYGTSCFMLKFDDHPRKKRMMRLFKTEIVDQVNR